MTNESPKWVKCGRINQKKKQSFLDMEAEFSF